MSSYEDMYADCPEEDPMCDIDIDYMYDSMKDRAVLCECPIEAIQLTELGFGRFIPQDIRYKAYTIQCRRNNQFPLNIQLWRIEQC